MNVLVLGLPGSGCSSLTAALRAYGLDAHESALGAQQWPTSAPSQLDSDPVSTRDDAANQESEWPAHMRSHVDAVVVAASARDGINDELASTWEALAENYIPRILVWTFSDVGRADDDDMRAIAERVLGEPTTAVALPLADDLDDFAGVLDLRDWQISDAGGVRDADAEHRDAAANLRDELIDAVLTVVDDESAVAQRMSGMEPNATRLRALVAQAFRSGQFVPSMAVKATEPMIGIEVLADVLRGE